MRTLLAGDGEEVCSGVGEGVTDSSGHAEGEGDSAGVAEVIGLGDSCASPIAAKATQQTKLKMITQRLGTPNSSIVAPVHVRENIVAPFAIAQKLFIEIVDDKLIVQTIEAGKVIHGTASGVFARAAAFHQKRPIA